MTTIVSPIGMDSADGNWSTFTATFTGTQAEAGDSITIELLTSGTQGNFGNVRFSDNLSSVVPEPRFLPSSDGVPSDG